MRISPIAAPKATAAITPARRGQPAGSRAKGEEGEGGGRVAGDEGAVVRALVADQHRRREPAGAAELNDAARAAAGPNCP
ncbi:MAG: hypothetical protein U1E53_18530 [Dongiaceae bacterium]